MNSIESLATFFGYCAIINFGIIISGVAIFSIAHESFASISAKMFGITNEQAKNTFFRVFPKEKGH